MSKEHVCMRFALLVALLVGCATKPNPKSCLDNHCSDPGLPFCDVDGSIGGEPNTCIAVECTANAFEECRGDRALICNATGDNYDLVACEFGCAENGCKACDGPQCEKRIVPQYLPTVCDELSASPSLKITQDEILDTNNALSCSDVVSQPAGPDICVLHYNTITVERNHSLKVIGTRAVALVADRALVIDGSLDVSASKEVSGPGASTMTSGTASTSGAAGGGGAGYRHAGGAGGSASTDGGAANGGPAATNPLLRTVLVGGHAPARATPGQAPGGAGGAVTLISCRDTVSVPGLIDAGGGGGQGDLLKVVAGSPTYLAAAGGGSGGTVVLQGMNVAVTGEIYANGGGGGGGGGNGTGGLGGFAGGDGARATTSAPGGVGQNGGGTGGAGGTGVAPGNGLKSNGAPGAGGGSAGFIVIYMPDLAFPTITPVGVSPPIEAKQKVGTN